MKVVLEGKLQELARGNERFENAHFIRIKNAGLLKSYTRCAFEDQSESFYVGGSLFVINTTFYGLLKRRVACKFILSQKCIYIEDDGELFFDGQREISEYYFEVHFEEEEFERDAYGYAWQVIEAFKNCLK